MFIKKNYIFIILLTIIFLFTIAFNFSSAFAGTEKQALIDSLIRQLVIIKEKLLEIQKQLQSILLKISLNKQIISNIPIVSSSELNITSTGADNAEDYYKSFVDSVLKVNFTNDELTKIKKDKDGRALLLEELIEQANSGVKLDDLRLSFSAWQRLDENTATELKKISVSSAMLPLHQWMVSWYQYHSQLAQKFSTENLSKDQIYQLQEQFKRNAENHNAKFKNSLTSLKKSPDFVLIPLAQAFTCGAFLGPFFHFGGRVTVILPCNFGLVETISPPCGGVFLFTYPILAANPYLYKKPTIGSAILGRSLVAPGVCPLGPCPACTFFPYEAIVLYFGTSLTP
jgi:hypothetical protein